MQNLLITTGGTGGHVILAQIIQEHLKNDFQVYFSTDVRGLKYLSSNTDKTIIIDTPKLILRCYLLLYLLFLKLRK